MQYSVRNVLESYLPVFQAFLHIISAMIVSGIVLSYPRFGN